MAGVEYADELPQKTADLLRQRYAVYVPANHGDRPVQTSTCPHFLRRRASSSSLVLLAMSRVVRLNRQRGVITVATAIAAFLTEHQLSPGSQRVYAGALRALQDHLDAETSLLVLDETRTARQVGGWFHRRYGQTAPATRVRQLAILRSACAFWRQRAWLMTDPTARLERPAVPIDRTRALTREQIASLWRRDDVALRERALWRLLYETAARASEILSLDIEDLDLPNKRARARSKGGATEWVFWQTGAALLLPRLLGGRGTGPVFLADRQPTRAVPTVDRCPLTAAPGCLTAAPQSSSLRQPRGGPSTSCDSPR
jgi:integrase